MTRSVRLDQLPPGVQEQVRSQAGLPTPRRKDRRGAERVTTDGVCWECSERFRSTAKWEAHSDQTGHRRFELIDRKAGAS